MKINFRTFVLAVAVLAAAVFTAKPAMAATVYCAHVPFSFVATGKMLPAGDYTVRVDKKMHVVTIEGQSKVMSWLVGPGSPSQYDQSVLLTFDKIGAGLVLRSVQVGPLVTSQLDGKYMQSRAAEEQIAAR